MWGTTIAQFRKLHCWSSGHASGSPGQGQWQGQAVKQQKASLYSSQPGGSHTTSMLAWHTAPPSASKGATASSSKRADHRYRCLQLLALAIHCICSSQCKKLIGTAVAAASLLWLPHHHVSSHHKLQRRMLLALLQVHVHTAAMRSHSCHLTHSQAKACAVRALAAWAADNAPVSRAYIHMVPTATSTHNSEPTARATESTMTMGIVRECGLPPARPLDCATKTTGCLHWAQHL